MQNARTTRLRQVLVLLTGVLILKVTVEVMLGYRNYLPPDFNSDFLRGRGGYFFGAYQWAFFPHIAAGPVSLIVGMLLVSERFRRRFPKWHRVLGRVQVANVLLLVAPSGLWMALYAAAGTVAAVGFAMLACLTAGTTALGWRAAMQRRFSVHRRWMSRSFLLLCSAVVIRLTGGLATVLDSHAGWFDSASAWGCWVVPLAAFELGSRFKLRVDRLSAPVTSR